MKRISFLLCFITLIVCMQFPIVANAASKYVTNLTYDDPHKIGGATFVAKTYSSNGETYYKIVMKKNGKTRTIAKNTTPTFATDGKVVYYVKIGQRVDDYRYKNTIYKYNIKTKKKVKIITGCEYTIKGFNGKYLYCGEDNGPDGVNLYALNLKTKKRKHMYNYAGWVIVTSKRVVTTPWAGDVSNGPIYSFKLDGSGKKKIADGGLLGVKNGKIYYSRVNYKTWKYKVYRCSLTGKNKKALTGWVDRIPEKYYFND